MVGRWSNWVLAAALVATLMAAMHGVMGESLFELLGGSAAGARLFGAALVVFVIAVGLFWERERVQHKWAAVACPVTASMTVCWTLARDIKVVALWRNEWKSRPVTKRPVSRRYRLNHFE
jgi:ABC-type Co2+ transport system permease subunit